MLIKVTLAERYNLTNLSSTGRGKNVLLRQYKFPNVYDTERDVLCSDDEDRLMGWNQKRFIQLVGKHLWTADKSRFMWFMEGEHEKILAYLVDAMEISIGKKGRDARKWTGFRVLGNAIVSSGNVLITYQIFSRGRGSKTKVYTGFAPNVRGYSPAARRMETIMGGE